MTDLATLKVELAKLGYKAVKLPKRRKPKFIGLGRKVYWYDGPSADQCKGPTLIHVGKLCPGGLLWPSDLARYYAKAEGLAGRIMQLAA